MKRYEFKGQWYTVNELSELGGIRPHTLRDRLRRGYSVEEALKVIPTDDSVKEFCEASYWKDWIGLSISDVYQIYWKWVVSGGGQPISKQGFSRHLVQLYPTLKTVPTKSANGYARIIRMR